MFIDEKRVQSLTAKKFELDCSNISLTQQVSDSPIMYSGPGTIYQDENGVLNLKAYHTTKDIKKEFSFRFQHHTPGKIIGREKYFCLEAVDMFGYLWVSENIRVSGDISFLTGGQVIKTTIREIRHQDERQSSPGSSLSMVVLGDYEIPCKERKELPNGGWGLNRTTTVVKEIVLELRKYENHLRINASAESGFHDEHFEKKLIEALSIILGKPISSLISVFSKSGQRITTIRSIDSTFQNNALLSSIKHSDPSDLEFFKTFIEKYVSSIKTPYSELFGFWHKVNQSWQAGILNASLSISVAIEGLLKTYFKESGLPDNEILKEAEEAKSYIKTLAIGARIKNMLFSNIGQFKAGSPKNALHKLVLNGCFPDYFVESWIKLRNRSAHADQLDLDRESRQKLIDETFTCLTLFYILIFLVIGYRGKYVDYSKAGWPEKELSIANDTHKLGDNDEVA